MSEDMRSTAGEEQALEIARCLRGIPAGKLKVWLDFMKTWSGLSAKDKRSFMNVLLTFINTHDGPDTGSDCPPPSRFPTEQQLMDIFNWELKSEKALPRGKIVSFHYYKIAVFKIPALRR